MVDLTKYKIVDYIFLSTPTNFSSNFAEAVMEQVKSGYIPLGGISISKETMIQTLVKVEPK